MGGKMMMIMMVILIVTGTIMFVMKRMMIMIITEVMVKLMMMMIMMTIAIAIKDTNLELCSLISCSQGNLATRESRMCKIQPRGVKGLLCEYGQSC